MSHRSNVLKCVIAACLVLAVETAPAQVILQDNFDSYPVNQFPPNWFMRFSGYGAQYQVVASAADAPSPPNAFKLEGACNWSSESDRLLPSVPDRMRLEVRVKLDNPLSTCLPYQDAIMGFRNYQNYATTMYGVGFAGGMVGNIPFQYGTWYNIRVELDKTTKTYSAWVDNQQITFDQIYTGADPDAVFLTAHNKGHTRVWYDDVAVTDITIPPSSDAFCDNFENGWQTNWTSVPGSGGTPEVVQSPVHSPSNSLKFRSNAQGNCGTALYRTGFAASTGVYSAYVYQTHYQAGFSIYIQAQLSGSFIYGKDHYAAGFQAADAQGGGVISLHRRQNDTQVLVAWIPASFTMNEWVHVFVRRIDPDIVVVGYERPDGTTDQLVYQDPNPLMAPGKFIVASCADVYPTAHFWDDVGYDPDPNASGCEREDVVGPKIKGVRIIHFGASEHELEVEVTASDKEAGNSTVDSIEYSLDYHPDQGSSTKVGVDEPKPNVQEELVIFGIEQPTSRIFLRARDDKGNWGDALEIPILSWWTTFELSQNALLFLNEPWFCNPLPNLPDWCFGAWCLGMSRTVMEYFNAGITPIPCNSLSWPPFWCQTYLDIVRYQVAGNIILQPRLMELKSGQLNLKDEYQRIKLEIERKRVTLIGLIDRDGSEEAEHAVLGIGIIELGGPAGIALIAVYDPNLGDLINTIAIDLTTGQPQYTPAGKYESFGLLPTEPTFAAFHAKCPVDLRVSDPLNRTIDRYSSEIEGAIYANVFDPFVDDTNRVVIISDPVVGQYRVTVTPTRNATETDVFNLWAYFDGITLPLAVNTPVGDAPPLGYQINTAPEGWLYGRISAAGKPLFGVALDISDFEGTIIRTVVTDDSGYYYADGIPNGDYTISVVTPLGYQAGQEAKGVTVFHVPVRVDFTLSELDSAPNPRSRAYWAHHLHKALQNKPQDYTKMQFAQFAALINQHFNQNQLNPVDFYTVLQPATQQDSLEVLRQLLHMVPTGEDEPFLKRLGKAQLMALMLNVVSGKVHQMQAISSDSISVSQAITYCDMLVNDEIDPPDDGGPGCASPFFRYLRADFILTMINLGLHVPAGMIPSDVIEIAYRLHEEKPLPTEFALHQNYPNPFNPTTEISFTLPFPAQVKLEIYNVMGQKVATLVDGYREAGIHTVTWDGSAVASGVYLYRLEASEFVETKKMILLK